MLIHHLIGQTELVPYINEWTGDVDIRLEIEEGDRRLDDRIPSFRCFLQFLLVHRRLHRRIEDDMLGDSWVGVATVDLCDQL